MELNEPPPDPATETPTHPPVAEPVAPAALPSKEHMVYAQWMHFGIFSALLGVPIVVSLVLWLVKRSESPFIDDHGKEAVNFQISLLVYYLVSWVFAFIVGPLTCGLGILMAAGAWVALLVLAVYNVVRAAKATQLGEYFRYPVTLRFIP